MKYFTIALFLGVITARDIELEEAKAAINALKIKVSKAGKAAIEKEARDVHMTGEAIKNTRPVRNLQSSLERWAHSKEMMKLQKLDQEFLASPAGKRLVAEWKDVGRVLENNIYENESGIHIPNKALQEAGDELDDVGYQYKKLEKSKWAPKYDKAFKDVTTNKEFGSVKRRAEQFKHSKPGQALKKEMIELKHAIKNNVKVTDIPKDWQKQTNMLKIEVSKEGQAKIEKEANEVGQTFDKVKDSRPFRNMGSSLERWADSAEVDHLKELDKKFLASPEGKRLVAEWTDFGEALKKSIKETPNGIHISNSKLDMIGDEADDVAYEYKKLEHSPWAKAYEAGWKAALHNKEAQAVERRAETFEKSAEWKVLEKELKELDLAIKQNLKITDIPKDAASMIKVTVTDPEPIEEAAENVEETMQKYQHSRPVRNVQSSLERWAHSPEVQAAGELEQKFLSTPRGQRMRQEWEDVFRTLDEAVYHNDQGFQIHNDDVQAVSDELDDVEHQYKELAKTPWQAKFEKAYGAAFTNKEAKSVERRFDSFEHSPEGHAIVESVEDFVDAVEDNVKVTDIPPEWKKDMYLF